MRISLTTMLLFVGSNSPLTSAALPTVPVELFDHYVTHRYISADLPTLLVTEESYDPVAKKFVPVGLPTLLMEQQYRRPLDAPIFRQAVLAADVETVYAEIAPALHTAHVAPQSLDAFLLSPAAARFHLQTQEYTLDEKRALARKIHPQQGRPERVRKYWHPCCKYLAALIATGLPVDTYLDTSCNTFLSWAITNNDLDAVQFALRRNAKTIVCNFPLLAYARTIDIARLLIDQENLTTQYTDIQKMWVLQAYLLSAYPVDVLQYIKSKGWDLRMKDLQTGDTLVHTLCSEAYEYVGAMDVFAKKLHGLTQAGVYAGTKNNNGLTAMEIIKQQLATWQSGTPQHQALRTAKKLVQDPHRSNTYAKRHVSARFGK